MEIAAMHLGATYSNLFYKAGRKIILPQHFHNILLQDDYVIKFQTDLPYAFKC